MAQARQDGRNLVGCHHNRNRAGSSPTQFDYEWRSWLELHALSNAIAAGDAAGRDGFQLMPILHHVDPRAVR